MHRRRIYSYVKPIGIFDSGIGGLSVYLSCKKLMPNENFIYFDDGHYAPYGCRSAEYVTARALENTRLLLECGAKAVVIACNTATTVAIAEVRRVFGGIIVGTEPAVAPALKATTGRLLVLATPLTCETLRARYDSPRLDFSPQPTLASEIEQAGGPEDLRKIAQRVTPPGYEGVILGCTHYSYLAPYINIKVFDGADGVARRLHNLLFQQSLLSSI